MKTKTADLEMARTSVRVGRLATMRARGLKQVCLELARTQGTSPAEIRRGRWTAGEMLDLATAGVTASEAEREKTLFERTMPRTRTEMEAFRGLGDKARTMR